MRTSIINYSKMVQISVAVPASSYGLVIGKQGATRKKLETDFNVRILIPRPGVAGHIVVSGAPASCSACEAAIWDIVRRKKASGKGSRRNPFPSGCNCCAGAAINGLISAFDHLVTRKHLDSMCAAAPELASHVGVQVLSSSTTTRCGVGEEEATSAPAPPPHPQPKVSVLDVAIMLADCRAFHEELGFDVDAMIDASVKEHERRQTAQAILDDASLLTPDPNWLRIESRIVVRWDDDPDTTSVQNVPLLRAPPLADLVARCHVDNIIPPTVHEPQHLPALLPSMDPKMLRKNSMKGKQMYPFDAPSGRLGVAVLHKLGRSLEEYDVLCGTAFIKALTGDTGAAKDVFYLQRRASCPTICVLHEANHFRSEDTEGHAVERLLCGNSAATGDFIATTTLIIGATRFLVTSEIDAVNEKGELVEMKASNSKRGREFVNSKVALQVRINGSWG